MKSGWEYVEENGVREKMAPYTLVANVLMSENGRRRPGVNAGNFAAVPVQRICVR